MESHETLTDFQLLADDVTPSNMTTEQVGDVDDSAEDELEIYLRKFSHTSPLQHALAVTFFFVFGIVGNSIVIHIYRRKPANYVGNLYLILIAAVDIFTCCVILPLFPFLKYMYRDPYLIPLRRVFFLLKNWVGSTYYFLLLIMAAERCLAIFWPFTFRQLRRKLHYFAL